MRSRAIPHAAAAVLLGALTVSAQQAPPPLPRPAATGDAALVAKARGIHERVIAMDTHVDISPANFTQLSRNYANDVGTQVNLPKMRTGGLDAPFLVVYVGQSNPQTTPDAFEADGYQRAYDQAIEKFEAIHRLTKVLAPDQIELALTAADVRRINAKGKKVALIGVENGYPLGDETTAVRRVKEFYDRGARYMSLAHNGHSQLSDSNTGEARRLEVEWALAARQAGHRGDERVRHHDRRLAPVEGVDDAVDRAVEGADHRVALRRARAVQPQPQHRRRAADRA